jgi:hypothetical protein
MDARVKPGHDEDQARTGNYVAAQCVSATHRTASSEGLHFKGLAFPVRGV